MNIWINLFFTPKFSRTKLRNSGGKIKSLFLIGVITAIDEET